MAVNKDLYPDQYAQWKDSVGRSLRNLGTPLEYQQSFTSSYQLPLNKLPILNWLNANATYNATYSWARGSEMEDGTSLGNTISNNRNLNLTSALNFESLYNLFPFLKKTNDRFKKNNTTTNNKNSKAPSRLAAGKKNDEDAKQNALLPLNKNTFQKEVTLKADTTVTLRHNKKSKRIIVTAKTADGRTYAINYKVKDDNTIIIRNQDTTKIMVSVTPKQPLEKQWWYNSLQHVSRFLMMARSMNISYRNQQSMTIPGFTPTIGDMLGQRTGNAMAPGLGFAFGFVGENYLNKALDNGWLLCADSVASPATINNTEDLQLRMTLEPVRDLKIDLNASRTVNKAKSIQYMYDGMPTTQSGSFNMTTISLKSALEGMGNANNGYRSKSFEQFCSSLDGFRSRVEAQYADALYPAGMTDANGTVIGGSKFNPEIGTVRQYSADVLIPAFLSAYTSSGGSSLDIFPALKRMLPNWSLRYTGLSRLPWLSDHFKTVTLRHAYKSVFAIGSYASFSTFQEYMNGRGFITDATTGNPVPNSMYNISTVSINESFAPLLGIDLTMHNNLTCKLEYRTTRVLSLSMTSIQINEALSKDWVVGAAYKLTNFNLFTHQKSRKVRPAKGKKNTQDNASRQTTSRSGTNHDLNLRLDISLRKQASITRDIATMTSSANSGNSAFKLSFMADYTLSRMLTLSAYYDRQTNTPLLSSSSYPTTTQDFGLSLKFSLTR